MLLKNLHLFNFKNYDQVELSFGKGFNCFTGLNGSGKTNLLDAIHYLCLCKSYFSSSDLQNIRLGEDFFMLMGDFEKNGKAIQISCSVKKGQKKTFAIDKEEYEKLSDHIGAFPLVIVAPNDSAIITEGSEERRKFIDNIISQCDKKYLETLIAYNKQLAQRNAFLKNESRKGGQDKGLLEIIDEQLVGNGQVIFEMRQSFLKDFVPLFNKHYKNIAESDEEVSLVYESHLESGNFEEQLIKSFERDIMLQYTSVGIHKDDLEFRLNGSPLKKMASQGQQKTFLLALKLAQYDFIKKEKSVKPLLLLDDLFDKLDRNRIKRLLELISDENFGQVFITDTDRSALTQLMQDTEKPVQFFEISKGEPLLISSDR